MKKFVLLSLVGLTILAFGGIGYAQQLYELDKNGQPVIISTPGVNNPPFMSSNYQELVVGEKPPVLEFKASGFIDVSSEYKKNTPEAQPGAWSPPFNLFGAPTQYLPQSGTITSGGMAGTPKGAAFNKIESYMEERFRLRFDAIMGKQVSGTFFFEANSNRWGDRYGTYLGEKNQMGNWNADAVALQIKNAFITFAVPPIIPVPVTVNIGVLPLAMRPTVVNYTDGSGMNVIFKPDPAIITFQWMKALENEDWAADDCDVYSMKAQVNVGTLTLGGYFEYYKMNTYPFTNAMSYNPATGTWTNMTPSGSFQNTTYWATPIVNQTAAVGWYGLFADGKVGPINLNLDFVYDSGHVAPHANMTANADASKVNYGGWLTRLAFDYPWEKFNFGFVGMYASGADMKKTSPNGYSGDPVANNPAVNGWARRVGSYIVPPNAEVGWDDESIVFYGTAANGINRMLTGYMNPGSNGATLARGPYGGTWFAKFYAQMKPAPWYRVTFLGMYIGDTTQNGNTIGNAVNPNGTPRHDATIGWEFDIFNDIQIYKNLIFRAGFGYLIAGAAMDYQDTRFLPSSANVNVHPSNPWALTTKLMFVF